MVVTETTSRVRSLIGCISSALERAFPKQTDDNVWFTRSRGRYIVTLEYMYGVRMQAASGSLVRMIYNNPSFVTFACRMIPDRLQYQEPKGRVLNFRICRCAGQERRGEERTGWLIAVDVIDYCIISYQIYPSVIR